MTGTTIPAVTRCMWLNIMNLYVLEYEIGESIIITAAAEQISEGGTFRRPRWVKNPAFGNE